MRNREPTTFVLFVRSDFLRTSCFLHLLCRTLASRWPTRAFESFNLVMQKLREVFHGQSNLNCVIRVGQTFIILREKPLPNFIVGTDEQDLGSKHTCIRTRICDNNLANSRLYKSNERYLGV